MSSNNSQIGKRKKIKEIQKKEKNRKLLTMLFTFAALIIVFYFYVPKFFSEKEEKGEDKIKTITPYEFNKEGEVTFRNTNDEFISKVDVELAEDNVERTQGLMFRIDLKENQGMLFTFPFENYQSFWMKNTAISLDIIFVNRDFEIVKVHKNTTPYSEESYPSEKPAKYVVEVVAGYTDKYNIKEGDNIVWRAN